MDVPWVFRTELSYYMHCFSQVYALPCALEEPWRRDAELSPDSLTSKEKPLAEECFTFNHYQNGIFLFV